MAKQTYRSRPADSILARPHARKSLARHKKPRALKEVRQLLEDDIGRDVLMEALQMQVEKEQAAKAEAALTDSPSTTIVPYSPPSKYQVLHERLSDKVLTGRQAITTVMQDCGVTVTELIKLVQSRTIALAMARSASRVDEVLESIEDAAIGALVECGRCKGDGVILTGEDDPSADVGEDPTEMSDLCPTCDGTGQLMKPGNVDSQKLYLGIHGLAPKSGGSAVGGDINIKVQAGARVDGNKPATQQESAITRVERIISSSGGGGSDNKTN